MSTTNASSTTLSVDAPSAGAGIAVNPSPPPAQGRPLSPLSTASPDQEERSARGMELSGGGKPARVVTKDSAVVAPYTIHSNQVRWLIVTLVAMAGLMSPLSANIYFPVIPAIAQDLNETVEKINLTVTVYMIFQGISPSFFGAICDVLGRRPVYILTFIIYLAACAGLAETHDYATLVGLRIVQATGSASVIAIGSGSIGDVAPPSERGKYMAVFGLGPMLGPCIGPISGGLLADAFGWQSLFWFCFALGAAVLVAILLFLPETLRSIVGNGSIPARGINLSLLSIWQERRRARDPDEDAVSIASVARPPHKGWKDVKPWAPLKMFREKDVLAILTFNSATYSLFYATTASTGSVFKSTYGLNETELGLCFIANGVGCLLASFVNAPRMTQDYKIVAKRVEERNKRLQEEGTFETKVDDRKKDLNDLSAFPIEHARLRSLPYYFTGLICANIAYGWLVDRSVHLSAPLIMQFIIGLTVTSMFNMVSTLMVDLYPGQSASATAANNLYRCLCGAAATAFVDPLISRMGIGWAFTFLSLLNCLFLPLIWLEYRYGMRWRTERAYRDKVARDNVGAKDLDVKDRTK
ncbi:hypothetical protein JCM10212_006799 [Sporobolomyces blumeae]